jgi:hypothetical protein
VAVAVTELNLSQYWQAQDLATLIPSLELPKHDDRHVLVAAIRCSADIIVTFNLKDFPSEYLSSFGVEEIASQWLSIGVIFSGDPQVYS